MISEVGIAFLLGVYVGGAILSLKVGLAAHKKGHTRLLVIGVLLWFFMLAMDVEKSNN